MTSDSIRLDHFAVRKKDELDATTILTSLSQVPTVLVDEDSLAPALLFLKYCLTFLLER